jgi:uncharacterized protein
LQNQVFFSVSSVVESSQLGNALLVNARNDDTIASQVELASTRATRRRGLLGRDALGAASALIIAPCCAIHTVGMRFAIDVIFVDRKGRVVRTAPAVAPWRIAIAPRAYAAIEMAAGSVAARGVAVGDALIMRAADTADPAALHHEATKVTEATKRSVVEVPS